MTHRTESLWRATHQIERTNPLSGDRETDVAIVGGGVTGLTAATLLARQGLRVALLERHALASGETGNTTSHLTEAVDSRYQRLRSAFGDEGARLVAQSQRDAIARIESFVNESGRDCGFSRVPGFLYTEREADIESLANELDAARRAGCAVEWVDEVPLPFRTYGAVRWHNQAQLHATAYAAALLQEARAHGARIYENTRVLDVHGGKPCRVETDRGVVRAGDVFVAANVPVNNRVLLHTKIAPYRSYAIAIDADTLPAGARIAAGLFWDTADPYHYTRAHQIAGRTYLIVGGEDHRTGEDTETAAHYDRLLGYAAERFGATEANYRWSGQIIEPVDGLPYIGRNTASRHVYVATGFSGNGITFGTLAGMIVSDLILGRANPYVELFDATRVKPLASAFGYVTENVAFPAHLLKDRLTTFNAEKRPVESLQPGEGGVFATDEGKLAVCRDQHGVLHSLSPVCTHLACDVAWNQAEQTWDCPCHGSRFSPDGAVINGPAVADLAWRPLPAAAGRRS
jgi:glycine/D-amino acid oxidase-like deaminating enzyme/nitrite reductase/ring-hydroxylating ferredoxin subunit